MQGTQQRAHDNATAVKALSDDCLVLIVGVKGKVREHLSGDLQDLLGIDNFAEDAVVGSLFGPGIGDALTTNIRRCLRSRRPYRVEATWQRDGADLHLELQLLPHGRDSAIVMVRDRTSTERFNEQVHELAFRDPLTGLPNEAALMHSLVEAVSDSQLREQHLAVLRVHLNGIRSINHNFGREAGNEVLSESARRLAAPTLAAMPAVAALSTMLQLRLARTRGDEFTLLVHGVSSADALEKLARTINEQLAAPFSFADNRLDISGSIGVAMFPQDGAEPKSLLCNADTALGEATLAGGSAVRFFSEAGQVPRQKRLDLEQELRWALEQEQFSLVFLPCFDFATGAINSVEALLRWRHPLRGNVPVDEIIPLTELTGLDEAIGTWVTESACEAAAQCKEISDIQVSLNMGARHAVARATPDRIAAQIAHCGLKPSRMLLEIRASDYFRHRKTMEHGIAQLTARGIGLVLDDFRAESMHLTSLAVSGVSCLKLGRALVANVVSDDNARRCTAAAIAMAHSLGIACSATGVENERQYEMLKAMNCDTYQGFFESSPLPLEALLERLKTTNAPTAARQVTCD
ncbi:MAG: EAL domain-containing protein [Pseudomonadota bacterium]